MTKFFNKTVTLGSALLLAVGASVAQADGGLFSRTKGVSFALPSGGGATVGGSLLLESGKELRVESGFDLDKQDGQSATFGLSADVGLRSYIAEAGGVRIFTQPGLFVAKAAGVDFADALVLAATYGLGGEYSISPNFSFGAQIGAALTFSNKFKAFSLKTGTSSVRATYYW